jgi:hypothetical protein
VEAGDPRLERARAAATAFCSAFGFPAEATRELQLPPVFPPVRIEREGVPVTAYRWLGGGRGAPYVQVELDDAGDVVVHGNDGDQELGPWRPPA